MSAAGWRLCSLHFLRSTQEIYYIFAVDSARIERPEKSLKSPSRYYNVDAIDSGRTMGSAKVCPASTANFFTMQDKSPVYLYKDKSVCTFCIIYIILCACFFSHQITLFSRVVKGHDD
ncbi:hypothetical protein QTP88_022620 [Uroleucon formosanum]